MHKVEIKNFQGPLDLLLQLIEQEKLEITEVSLADVTDQFIQHVNVQENIDPHELADFLVVAAKLLYIKSKVLLPSLFADAEEGGETSLKNQLEVYKRYIAASKGLHYLYRNKHYSFARTKIPVKLEETFFPPPNVEVNKLAEIFQVVLKKIEPIVRLPKEGLKKVISIREKIEHIRELIMTRVKSGFKELTSNAKNKTEVLVTFLALLELVKQKTINVEQGDRFGDIQITKLEQQ
jgi:segregation and condensation protein A